MIMQHSPPAPPKQNFNMITFDTLSRTKRPSKENSVIICSVPPPQSTKKSQPPPTPSHRFWTNEEHGDAFEYSFNELMLTSDMTSFMNTAKFLRNTFGDQVTRMFAMHPSIDILCVSNAFNYAVFKTYDYMTNLTLQNLQSLHTIIKNMYQRARCVHGNICPMLIGKTKDDHFIIRPPLTLIHTSKIASHEEHLNVMSSILVTPLHVIIDMLSSTFEKERIEYYDFRQKFMRYWEHLLPNGLKQQIPQWLFKTFSAIAGCTDYIDFAINRYCLIEKNEQDGRQYIRKDPSKAFGYLYDIDVTCLAISTFLMQRPVNTSPPLDVIQYLGFMIRGDVPTAVDEPITSDVPLVPKATNPSRPPVATPPPSVSSPTPQSTEERKRMYKGQMRVVRTDEKGDYILWQKQKIYV